MYHEAEKCRKEADYMEELEREKYEEEFQEKLLKEKEKLRRI
jgi:hypothetical protein